MAFSPSKLYRKMGYKRQRHTQGLWQETGQPEDLDAVLVGDSISHLLLDPHLNLLNTALYM